jgi:hypothetical protein
LIVSVGKAGVVVTIQGVSSNSQDVTIVAPVITSIDPNAVTAGGSPFTLTINGSGFVAGATARWNGSALPTTFVNEKQLTAGVSAQLIATAGIVSITASIQTAVSNSASLTVSPTLTSLSPASTAAGGSAFTLTVNGAGFADSSTVFWNETALATTFTDSTRLSASVPANLISSPASVQITAASGGARSNALTFTVQSTSKVTITGLDPAPVPTQGTTVGVALDNPSPTALQGTLTLTFRPAPGLPTGFTDPFLQFAAGGTVLNFTVPAGTTVATLPQNGAIQLGTVAGEITVTLTRLVSGTASVLPSPAPSRTITVSKLVPVITPNSVRITNVTANGLDVEATAYSTTLELVNASYTFEVAQGVRLTGSATATVDLSSVATQWYANTQYGGMVRLRVHFPIQGDPTFIQRVSLILTNSVGPSVAVAGGK